MTLKRYLIHITVHKFVTSASIYAIWKVTCSCVFEIKEALLVHAHGIKKKCSQGHVKQLCLLETSQRVTSMVFLCKKKKASVHR
jgi:hypothetical protein